jgi:hypothetical protein
MHRKEIQANRVKNGGQRAKGLTSRVSRSHRQYMPWGWVHGAAVPWLTVAFQAVMAMTLMKRREPLRNLNLLARGTTVIIMLESCMLALHRWMDGMCAPQCMVGKHLERREREAPNTGPRLWYQVPTPPLPTTGASPN